MEGNLATLNSVPKFGVAFQQLAVRLATLEIAENLIRRDVTSAQRAKLIAKRKTAYEAVHPETKHGATGRSGRKSQILALLQKRRRRSHPSRLTLLAPTLLIGHCYFRFRYCLDC